VRLAAARIVRATAAGGLIGSLAWRIAVETSEAVGWLVGTVVSGAVGFARWAGHRAALR
jgi:hypothetical protein